MIDLQYIPPFYQNYIRWVDDPIIYSLLEKDRNDTLGFFKSIPGTKHDYAYAIRKWSVKQTVQHLIDAERVFTYRAFRFSRNDPSELHGFDQNDYVAEANLDKVEFNDLVKEWASEREATINFYKNLHRPYLRRMGRSNGVEFSVESLAYITVGHTRHHINILKEKYL